MRQLTCHVRVHTGGVALCTPCPTGQVQNDNQDLYP